HLQPEPPSRPLQNRIVRWSRILTAVEGGSVTLATELGDCPGPAARLRHDRAETTMKRQQLQEWLQRLESRVVLLARDVRWRLMPMLRAGWGVVRPVLRTALEVLIARLFMLTQPALMQIGWFASAHDTVMPWKEALTARVRASWAWRWGRVWKERVKRVVADAARRWRPTLEALKPVLAAAAKRVR